MATPDIISVFRRGETLNTGLFLDVWTDFLQKIFKADLPALNKIQIPKTHPDFGWGVVVPKSLTVERVIESYSGICPVWRWTNDNLDSITTSARSADANAYVSWFRNRVEPEEKYKNMSADDIRSSGINGSALIERLLLGRWFAFMTDGEHLDVLNITRCDATRDYRKLVPAVYFETRGNENKLYIFRHEPTECDDILRTREAIS